VVRPDGVGTAARGRGRRRLGRGGRGRLAGGAVREAPRLPRAGHRRRRSRNATGSPATLGLDWALDYKAFESADALGAAIKEKTGGVDVYFDNVGGWITDAIIPIINRRARIVICGTISQYSGGLDAPELGPRFLHHMLYQRATIQGMLARDYLHRMDEMIRIVGPWVQRGEIVFEETVVTGFEKLPATLNQLFTGDHRGKLLVEVVEKYCRVRPRPVMGTTPTRRGRASALSWAQYAASTPASPRWTPPERRRHPPPRPAAHAGFAVADPDPALRSAEPHRGGRHGREIAMITFVAGDRQFIRSRVGTQATEASMRGELLHLHAGRPAAGRDRDATQDVRFADNPFVRGPRAIRSYAACRSVRRPRAGHRVRARRAVAPAQRRPARDPGRPRRHGRKPAEVAPQAACCCSGSASTRWNWRRRWASPRRC
jgi:hypothetical protein